MYYVQEGDDIFYDTGHVLGEQLIEAVCDNGSSSLVYPPEEVHVGAQLLGISPEDCGREIDGQQVKAHGDVGHSQVSQPVDTPAADYTNHGIITGWVESFVTRETRESSKEVANTHRDGLEVFGQIQSKKVRTCIICQNIAFYPQLVSQPDEFPVGVQAGVSPEDCDRVGQKQVEAHGDVGCSSVSKKVCSNLICQKNAFDSCLALQLGKVIEGVQPEVFPANGGREVNRQEEESHGDVGPSLVSQRQNASTEDVQTGQSQSKKVCLYIKISIQDQRPLVDL